MFSCEFLKIFKNTFFYKTSLVATSAQRNFRFWQNIQPKLLLACFNHTKQIKWNRKFSKNSLILSLFAVVLLANCVKSVQIRCFFLIHSFLHLDRTRIQSECRKIRARKKSVFGHISHSGKLKNSLVKFSDANVIYHNSSKRNIALTT